MGRVFATLLSVLFVGWLFWWGSERPPVSRLSYTHWTPNVGTEQRAKYLLVCNATSKIVGSVDDDQGWSQRRGWRMREIDIEAYHRVANLDLSRQWAEDLVKEHHSCG
jgi:hypothetical protein